MNAFLKAWGEFLQEADARFRALAAEVRALAVPGPAGTKGDVGEKGADGRCGPIGPPGPAGEKGIPGAVGDRGEKGEDGIGVVGPSGPPGTDGIPGRDGRDGTKGDPGRDGKDGTPGTPGRDGITQEQFQAALEGATARAVADFIASLEIDGRMWKMGDRTFRMPLVIYRGVYVEGQRYERGDQVTWAGSQWHANEDTEIKPGEASAAWTLCAKRGRDGKDGKDGAPAPVRVGAR